MDTLKELVKIVNRKRLSKLDIFDKTFLSPSNSNLYYKLYEGLESNKIIDDITAANFLYGSKEKDAKFRKLKSRFKSKLQKTLLLLDTEETFINTQGRAYYECSLNNQIIEIIIKISGTTKLVYELAKENYLKAQQYNFYDILRNYSFYLLSYYALNGNSKKFDEEHKRYLKYLDFAYKEQYAKSIYFKSSIQFENQAPITNTLLDEVFKDLSELNSIRGLLQNTEIDFYYFYLALEYYQKSNSLSKLIEICDEADKMMIEKPAALTNTRKTILLIFNLSALLSSKKYKDGLELIQKESKLVIQENNYNWFTIKELHFKIFLQQNDIVKAKEIYETVLENKNFKRQVERIQERWKIYNAYLVFMDNYLNKGDFKFSLAKFLNEVPVNSKDKSGFNFAIRIIEILFHAARKDYNLIFSKMDALRIYRSRYLNDNTYKRNHLFLGALLKAEKSGFDGKEMAKADWQELKELRIPNKYLIADWEIIPYETLWDIFVELAKQ